jgi:hypothetical protein
VALSFDEIAMEVLAWLDSSSCEWDMYVDLPAITVRYCFRTLADATPFKRRFLLTSESGLSAAANDRGWPYQVVLPARFCERGSYNEIHGSAAICAREVMLFHDGPGFISAVSASLPTMKSSFRDSAEKNLIRRNEARPTIWRDGEGNRPVTIFNSLEQQLSIEKDKAIMQGGLGKYELELVTSFCAPLYCGATYGAVRDIL